MNNAANFDILPKHNRNKIILTSLHAQKFPFTGESHGICAISGYIQTHFPEISVEIYDLQMTALSYLINRIKLEKPVILGISAKLQTFDQMQLLYKRLKEEIPKDELPIIVAGNAIPNFNGQMILENYFPDILVAIGEGEIVMEDLIWYIRGRKRLEEVRNIYFITNQKMHFAQKDYLSGEMIPMPDRTNSLAFYKSGGEVYLECSRGCAYGNCTFCACSEFLGSKIKSKKWRPRPVDQIITDLQNLAAAGITNVTFSDEDFFGIGLENVLRIKELAEKIIENNIAINIRLNAWVKSIFSITDNQELRNIKEETIHLLKNAGLVKVFMGLESGSETQLKRYSKGFTLNEFTEAFSMLKRHDIECEFGFILLDPLVSMDEIRSSLEYLETNNFIHEITSIYKELRVQVGNSYVYQVRQKELELNVKMLNEFDFNTQGYPVIQYQYPEVQFFANHMREWVEIIYKLYYSLRIFTRYTEQSVINVPNNRINRKICFDSISAIRQLEFEALKAFVSLIDTYGLNTAKAIELLLIQEKKRSGIIAKLIDTLDKSADLQEINELLKEALNYQVVSKQFNQLLYEQSLSLAK